MRCNQALLLGQLLSAASPAGSGPQPVRPATFGLGPFRWDFEAPGKMHDLVLTVVGVAWGFMPFAIAVALAVEAFGRAPGQPREFAAVVWRTVVIVFLLLFYVPLFNGLAKHVFDPLAEAVTPASGFGEFLRQSVEAAKGLPSSEADQVVAEGGLAAAAGNIVRSAGYGGFFYDSLVSLLLLVAEGLIIVIGRLGKLLAALLFCLGPLALVAAVPRPSRTGTRWFTHFVTIHSWPILSGLLLSILVALGREGADSGGYLAAIVASLLTAAMALVTPRLASQVVGGTLENLIASGWDSAKGIHRDATGPGIRDAFRSVVGGPARGANGDVHWEPGMPQRAVVAMGSAVASKFRSFSGNAASSGNAGGAVANPPPSSGVIPDASAPTEREGSSRRSGSGKARGGPRGKRS